MTQRLDAPSAEVRIRVLKRDRFQCTYCGVPGTDAELEVDHIIAVSNGGSHHMSNLTTACRACNQKKGSGALRTFKPPSRGIFSLVGMFVHVLEGGIIKGQGEIIVWDGAIALVQFFSWFDGQPFGDLQLFTKSRIYSSECRLYASADLMIQAYESEVAKGDTPFSDDYYLLGRDLV